jgi:hypothetical protein
MRIKRRSKNHVFLNRNGEHIAGYLISEVKDMKSDVLRH